MIPPPSINVGAFEAFLGNTSIEYVARPSQEELLARARLVRDPKVIHVAFAAITARVDFLVTQGRDFMADDESTREVQQLLNVCIPGAFLRELMGWTSEQLEASSIAPGRR